MGQGATIDGRDETASAGRPLPAGPDARTHGRVDWRVILWPNRSFTRRGLDRFTLFLGACFLFFALMTVFAPGGDVALTAQMKVFAVVILFMAVVLGFVWLAFRRNDTDGRYHEIITLDEGRLLIEANHPKKPLRRWEFASYWTKVETRTAGPVENQLVLSHRGTAVAIGAFLSPEERESLAEEIRTALRRFGS